MNFAKFKKTLFYRTPLVECFWSIAIWWWGSISSTLTFSLYKVIHATYTPITDTAFFVKNSFPWTNRLQTALVNWCKTESKKNRTAFKLVAFTLKYLVEQLKGLKWRKSAFFQKRLLFGFFDFLNLPLSKIAWYPIF